MLNSKYRFLFWRPVTAIDPTSVAAEYPGGHGTNTSAMAEVFGAFLGTDKIDLDVHGFDSARADGNLTPLRHLRRGRGRC